jgi:hypothetical protein
MTVSPMLWLSVRVYLKRGVQQCLSLSLSRIIPSRKKRIIPLHHTANLPRTQPVSLRPVDLGKADDDAAVKMKCCTLLRMFTPGK